MKYQINILCAILVSTCLFACKREESLKLSTIDVLPQKTVESRTEVREGKLFDVQFPFAETKLAWPSKMVIYRKENDDIDNVFCILENQLYGTLIVYTPVLDPQGVPLKSWTPDYKKMEDTLESAKKMSSSGISDPRLSNALKSIFPGAGRIIPFKGNDILGFAAMSEGHVQKFSLTIWDSSKKRCVSILWEASGNDFLSEEDVWTILHYWKWKSWSGGSDMEILKDLKK